MKFNRGCRALCAGLLLSSTALAADIVVSGRVVGPGGAPVPEATLELRPTPAPYDEALRTLAGRVERDPERRALSAADGSFSVPVPRAGLWRLTVRAPGHVPLRAELSPLLESRVLPDAQLERDAGLQVRVATPDGTPLPGARIQLAADVGRRWFGNEVWSTALRAAVTGGNGTARLPRADAEASLLSVVADGFAFVELRNVRGTAASVELPPGRPRTLLVQDEAGRPVAGATVSLGRTLPPAGRTAEDGTLTLFLAGEVPLQVAAADGRTQALRLAPAATDDPAARQRIVTLSDRARVQGRLIDADSRQAVGGALVWSEAEPWAAVRTSAGGAYSLGLPARGRARLRAGATGYLPTDSIAFTPGGSRAPTLILRPAAAIEGRVADADGQPLAGVALALEEKQGGSTFRIRIGGSERKPSALTDASGRFRISPVDPQHGYELKATAAGYAPATRAILGLQPHGTLRGVALTLDAGLTLSGRIVDVDGEPLEDARLELTAAVGRRGMGLRMAGSANAAPAAAGASDRAGGFRLEGLAAGAYDLEVRRSGFAKRKIEGIALAAGAPPHDVGELVLEEGVRLSGTVLDVDGAPLEGAAVRVAEGGPVFMLPGAAPPGSDAVSGADGYFTIDELAAGEKVELSVSRTGYVSAQVAGVELPHPDPLRIEMEPASRVEGRVVTPDDEPIPGATVNLRRSVTMSFGGRVMQTVSMEDTTADADGVFRFEDVEPGKISLQAVAPGWQEARRENIEVPRGADLLDVVIPLDAGAVVEGRVLAPDGRPAIGATVDPVRESAGMARFGGTPVDGDGRYRIDGLEPGEVSIEARHDDYPRVVRDIEARAGDNRLDLAFSGGNEVRGRVTALDGSPIGLAALRLASEGRMFGGPAATSEADGSFVLRGVNDGRYSLWAEADGFAASAGEIGVEVAGEPVDGVDVVLEAGGSVTGRVLGVDERDYPKVAVEARLEDGFGFGSGSVDYEGRYRIDNLAPGAWRLEARVEGSGRRAEGRASLDAGALEVSLDLQFGGGVTLSGRALQAGEPLRGTSVAAEGLDVAASGWTDTDELGGFSLEGLEPGRYRVRLRNWQTGLSYQEEIDLATSREIEFDVPTGRVSGRVRDATDRQPLSGVRVTLVREDPQARGFVPSHGSSSDMDGRFEIGSVTDGDWILRAERKGYAARTQSLRIQSGRDVDDLELSLEATEGLTLEVRLPSGLPPDEVHAAVLDPAGQPVASGRFATGENGTVRLSSVPAGSWQVLVGAAGAATSNLELQAPGGLQPVRLQPATRLRVDVPALAGGNELATLRVRDAAGRPYRTLNWFGSAEEQWRIVGGSTELRSLPPGSWTVEVRAGERSWSGQATTGAAQPATLTLD